MQDPQLNIAQQHIIQARRAFDGWSTVPRSPNLGLDTVFSTSPGPGENYNHFRPSGPFKPCSPYTLQVPPHMPYEVSPDPIRRFQNIPGPWVPEGIADLPTHPDTRSGQSRSSGLRTRYSEPNTSFSQYQTKPASELESDITGPYPSDSGYGTRSQATNSILSSDPVDPNQECSSITGQIGGLDCYSEEAIQVYSQPNQQTLAPRTERRPDRNLSQTSSLQCHYADCGAIVKCQSELKYARLCYAFLDLDAKRLVM